MDENIPLLFDLPAVARKKVSAVFDGGRITSDDGVGWEADPCWFGAQRQPCRKRVAAPAITITRSGFQACLLVPMRDIANNRK